MKHWFFIVLAATIGLSACSKKEEAAGPQSGSSQAAQNTGKILQILQAGEYTYAEVDAANGKRVWIAGAHLEAKVGDNLQWADAAVMRNFNAKSLNRTFDEILFVSQWGLKGAAPVQVSAHGTAPGAGGQPSMTGHPPMTGMPSTPGGATAMTGNSGEVKSVTSAGGYSYIEVQQSGGTVWLAVPETQVAVGNKVQWENSPVMRNFNAKSLNRVFESIIFASGVSVSK